MKSKLESDAGGVIAAETLSVLAQHKPYEELWCAPGCNPRRLGDQVCDLECRNGAACGAGAVGATWC